MKHHLCSALALLLASSMFGAEPDSKPAPTSALGRWKAEFDSRVGHLKYLYEFHAQGDKVIGSAIRERDGVKTKTDLVEVSLSADRVEFVEPIKIQDQDIRIEYKGKLSGDEIKLTRKVGEYATTEIVASRVKDSLALDGKWRSEFDSQIGKQTYTYEFKVEGEKLTGKAIGQSQFGKFETPITEGKIGRESFFFVEMLKLPDNEIRIEYTGKPDGETLKLARKVGDIANEEILAIRAPASSEK
jgi:hypothetical protein